MYRIILDTPGLFIFIDTNCSTNLGNAIVNIELSRSQTFAMVESLHILQFYHILGSTGSQKIWAIATNSMTQKLDIKIISVSVAYFQI